VAVIKRGRELTRAYPARKRGKKDALRRLRESYYRPCNSNRGYRGRKGVTPFYRLEGRKERLQNREGKKIVTTVKLRAEYGRRGGEISKFKGGLGSRNPLRDRGKGGHLL